MMQFYITHTFIKLDLVHLYEAHTTQNLVFHSSQNDLHWSVNNMLFIASIV